MKLNKLVIAVLACLMVVNFVSLVPAATEQTGEVTITGVVEEMDGAYIIQADDADYMVEGFDVSAMVGQEVKATGVVTENDEGKVITATIVETVAE